MAISVAGVSATMAKMSNRVEVNLKAQERMACNKELTLSLKIVKALSSRSNMAQDESRTKVESAGPGAPALPSVLFGSDGSLTADSLQSVVAALHPPWVM